MWDAKNLFIVGKVVIELESVSAEHSRFPLLFSKSAFIKYPGYFFCNIAR
jgi:hypothetical protein